MTGESAAGTLLVGRKVSTKDEMARAVFGNWPQTRPHSERGDLHEQVTTAETSVLRK
jgi:hypothetical protein